MATQAERRAATREKVLAATIECLVDRGYVGTSFSTVAERAQVSRGAVNHHYPSKQGLVIAAFEEISARRFIELREQIEGVPDGQGRLARGLDGLWDAFIDPLFVAGLEIYVAARTDPLLGPRVSDLESDTDERARDFIRFLLKDHDVRDLDDFADVLVHTLRGVAVLWATGAPRPPLERTWQRIRTDILGRCTSLPGRSDGMILAVAPGRGEALS